MRTQDTTTRTDAVDWGAASAAAPLVPVLVLVWSHDAPQRVGERIRPPSAPVEFGRGASSLGLERGRGDRCEPTGPLASPRISRRQWIVRAADHAVRLANEGRLPTLRNGVPFTRGDVLPGDVIELQGEAIFVAALRPLPTVEAEIPDFGLADADGIVGESPSVWALRDQLAFAAARDVHTLLLGPSGVGKELAARSIHRRSRRHARPFVARNAATFPATLIDAELFGHVRDYPNPGMADRPGLIGEAHGGALFLDEIGELGPELQTHLLRVLDHGDYQRLGEGRRRTADLRVLAATNRPVDSLRTDLAARFALTLTLPGLDAHLEDVPLISRHLLQRIAATDPDLAHRFVVDGEPRLDPRLALQLVRGPYHAHVRELEQRLWKAMLHSPGPMLAPPPEAPAVRPPDEGPGREAVLAALEDAGWVRDVAWRALGLSSRHALLRLMRRYDIPAR